MRKIIFIIASIFMANTALGATWTPLGTNEDGVVEIDLDSIVREGDRVFVWSKYTLIRPREISKDKLMTVLKDYMIINCVKRTSATATLLAYDYAGTELHAKEISDPVPKPIVPESSSEKILKAVCKK